MSVLAAASVRSNLNLGWYSLADRNRPIPAILIADCTITDVRSVAELKRWFPLSELDPDALVLAA